MLLCAATAGAKDGSPLGDAFDANNWASVGRTAGETHYSPLTEINRETVGRLRLAWTLDLDLGNAQATPLAVEGIIYVAAGYSIVYAVDAKTGKSLWRFDPEVLLVAGKETARRIRRSRARLLERAAVRRHARWPVDRAGREKGNGALEHADARSE